MNELIHVQKESLRQTLIDLRQFTQELTQLSLETSELLHRSDFFSRFTRLIDGLGLLNDAIIQLKKSLSLTSNHLVKVLEADLLFILQEILSAQEKKQYTEISLLLREELPSHLQQWRENGIPIFLEETLRT